MFFKTARPEPVEGYELYNTALEWFDKLTTSGKKIAFTVLISTLIINTIQASPGCMDNSWHMTRPFDAKEYHIVTRELGKHKTFCPCPCRKLSLNRGECLECGHRHDMQPWIIIRTPKKQKTNVAPAA